MGVDALIALRPKAHRALTWVYGRLRPGRSPRQGLRILMYHSVGTPIEGDARGLYCLTPAMFEKHMCHLAERYAERFVFLDSPALEGDSLRIAVTFDDGYQDNLTVAAPLLARWGIPFTVFVCTGAVAERKAGFLDPGQVRELAGLPGAEIGSHTITHPHLTELDDRALNEELSGSKAYLEDLLGRQIDVLSYPNGAVDRRVRNAAEHAGYRIAATSRFDVNPPGRDPLLLCRSEIWAEDDIVAFDKKIQGDWDWNRWRHSDPAEST